MNERKDQNDREEGRFEEMFTAAKGDTPQPDQAFLKQLKKQSTQTFLAGHNAKPAKKRKFFMKDIKNTRTIK